MNRCPQITQTNEQYHLCNDSTQLNPQALRRKARPHLAGFITHARQRSPRKAVRCPDRRCRGPGGLLGTLSARGVVGSDGARLPLASDAPDVVLLNNEAHLDLKILVSAGGRCNLTNARVDERDNDIDAPHIVRRLLRGFPQLRSEPSSKFGAANSTRRNSARSMPFSALRLVRQF